MENKNNKTKYVISGAKKLAFVAKWFLVGYGIASLAIDVDKIRKA